MRANLRRFVYQTLISLAAFCPTTQADLPAPAKNWFPFSVSFDPQAPGILSARHLLDAPAGRHGFVVARNSHFYTGDRRIRFWGVNLCFAANFPTHENAEKLADRFANFGVNCVRFHHMDSAPFPRGIFTDGKLETLSPEAIDRLDYFIAALRKRGIYANLNLHVSRSLTRARGWPEAETLPKQDKMINLFHPELIDAQKQYARDLLTHLNPYTGLRYCDEPAIAMIEINNENTMFIWDGIRTLAKLPLRYKQILIGRYAEWCKTNPMPSPTLFSPDAPQLHWMRFLQWVDESYFTSMRSFLKDELDVKVPITGTIVLGPQGMKSQSKMDFADGHWYWDHPTFPGREWDAANWRIHNQPMIANPQRTPMRLASSRIAGMPFTVTEYNHSAPNEYQAECIPFIAAYAALQDWDGVFLFAYSHDEDYFKTHPRNFFDIEGNPAKMAMMPFGARIFLQPLIEPLRDKHEFVLREPSSLRPKYYQDISGYLRETQGLDLARYQSGQVSVNLHLTEPRLAEPKQFILSEGNPLIKDGAWMQVVQDRAIVFIGWGNNYFTKGALDFWSGDHFTAMVIIPRDPEQTFANATHLLMCDLGQTTNTGIQWNEARTTVGKNWGTAPPVVSGSAMRLSSRTNRITFHPLNSTGHRLAPATNPSEPRRSIWYEIEVEPAK